MKLILLLISTSLLIFGFLNKNQLILITGAVCFILIQTATLVWIYRSSKQYRTNPNQIESQNKRKFVDIFSKIIENIIIFSGLIAMIIDNENEHGLFVAGAIIWIGIIVIYFLGGVIIRCVTGIPLRMGYGGWYVYRRYQRH